MPQEQESRSAIRIGAGVLLCGLVMTGVAGTIYQLVSPGGWIAHAFGHGAKAGFSLFMAVALLVGFAYLSRTWTPSRMERNFAANLAVALFALAGVVYLAHFCTTGAL
jgi:hypothetical protein